MTIHLFDVAPLRPLGGGEVPTLSLVVVDGDRVLAVDVGFPSAVFEDPTLIGFERFFLRLPHRPEASLLHRLASIGLCREDLTDIVLTHLHSEHAAGIVDFPDATVHVAATELETSRSGSLRARVSYRSRFFAHDPRWRSHAGTGDWLGVSGCSWITGDVVLVPLPGHTVGHCGVAVRLDDAWLLHTGDAGYGDPRTGAPAAFPLAQYERISMAAPQLQASTRETLRRLAARDDVHTISSHRYPPRLPLAVAEATERSTR
ncbi:MBL fold metallo-hydrolase [Tsukamurella ocularis]|uniref:MBL fold metallo-hydrolase n=1 Tax=Tsukamurella ocularis TaxID=1970234 RepID=UPI0021679D0F|nr:MBL fold metallo-hydrolase [Tsukamurella ocularis]MCS3779484.1 glyoxylase-like metal-dependent hydrolase (beta-lactamase superfamily II) [Tsukamurella ocularis]MCS3788043.1 glyoxylase-like metal-dependent hydrolase (beta-lactamase superfamily II) [Tsukamurella ocularis]MCS3852359.1 glyoxylase-like metal-dependent hydrolase (beta-lactamase superfamily II) [Tsukamurella ocularis]